MRDAISVTAALLVTLAGCLDPQLANRGHAPVVESVAATGRVSGAGLESQDIVAMTDSMAKDILACPTLKPRPGQPYCIVIDSQYFRNESSTPINKNLITERLRIELNRAAQGQLKFVSRENLDMLATEQDLRHAGLLAPGATSRPLQAREWDFRLNGKLMSMDARNKTTGEISQYHLVVFELVDHSLAPAWGKSYELRKSALDDVVYR